MVNYKSYFTYIYLFIIIVALYNIINYFMTYFNNKESFTSKIRETYRPYLRNARFISEGFYNNNKNNINYLFRKFGIY
jgi:hypothetical protein